ncbi:hypothetical protein [Nocardia sp. AG03]|uniref:hypothetical protein n=1 Tax=Nocardia sp. AG03 TaxID=3025312 RepID=UPI0024181E4E|nr:hypothetical protein [Nocardia sp. AG03]
MITLQPILEIFPSDGFALWPVSEVRTYGFLVLSGELTPAEVGTAVKHIAAGNDIDPEHDGRPSRPADPVDSFLHGLLTVDALYIPGGLRVTDTTTGVVFVPGCCSGLEDWHGWYRVLEGSVPVWFGHDPDPRAERCGDTVRLTTDGEQSDSPVIEVSATELRQLLDGAERDLLGFLGLVQEWAERQLSDQAGPVTAALARALNLPATIRTP